MAKPHPPAESHPVTGPDRSEARPARSGPGTSQNEPEPRWPAVIALLAAGGLYTVLPASLTVGPGWLLLVVTVALSIPTAIARRQGNHALNHVLGHLVAAVVTAFMVWSLAMLVMRLPEHRDPPTTLLRSAAALWCTNIVVFASWYWRLDGGGPHVRDTIGHQKGAFLFPQMTLDVADRSQGRRAWTPNYVDYLFLAFSFSTALSPADTPVLSRWAKMLMMIQATISLTVIVILAGRSVNIL